MATKQDERFARGDMLTAPCFNCGYNGPGYFQPETHACASKHHKLYDPNKAVLGGGTEIVVKQRGANGKHV